MGNCFLAKIYTNKNNYTEYGDRMKSVVGYISNTESNKFGLRKIGADLFGNNTSEYLLHVPILTTGKFSKNDIKVKFTIEDIE
jgi:hypothetical protein